MKFLALFIFLVCSQEGFTQNKDLASLFKQMDSLEKKPSFAHDTLRVKLLTAIARLQASSVNADSGRVYAGKAIKLAQKIGWLRGELYAYRRKAQIEGTSSKYYAAIENAQKALTIAEKLKDTKGEARCLRTIGDAYHWLEKPKEALHYFQLQLKKSDKNDPDSETALTYIDLGALQTGEKQYEEAKNNILKGIEFAKINKGNTFIGYGYATLGLVEKAQKRYQEATKSFENALHFYENDKADYLSADVFNYLGEMALEQKKYPEAILFADKALDFGKRLGIDYSQRDAAKTLFQCYKQYGDMQKALFYHEALMKYKDAMQESTTNQRLEGLRFEYENQKQQELISQQHKENQIQKKNNYLLLAGLLLILALAGLLLLGNRKLRDKNTQIEKIQGELRTLNTNLETNVEQRTTELLETRKELLEQESEYRKQLAEIEMTALRAQMNPHFIFNVLNSINRYTLANDADAASAYLTKFSRLIRLVLENSKADFVTLQNELEALRLYIEIEAMRFKGKVSYRFDIQEDIDQQFTRIPPLLLQPFIENAIWHGLMHKQEGGEVNIRVSQPNENILHIEIEDNGIGRAKAMEYKSKSATKNKSLGMQMTSDRIKIINQLYNAETQVRIEDLYNNNQEAIGTKVVIEIPV